MVSVGSKGQLLVGECKWGRVTAAHLRSLRERAVLIAGELGGIERVHTALFTGRGEADDEVRSEAKSGDTLLFGPEDLC